MALIYTSEMNAITNDYFVLDDGAAFDIFYQTSWWLNYLLKQRKGYFKLYDGGEYIRVLLDYDEVEGGFYLRGESISSDHKETIQAARFAPKHCYGNGTVLRVDLQAAGGEYGQIDLIKHQIKKAQQRCTNLAASALYDEYGTSSSRFTGFGACCDETTSRAYGGFSEDDLESRDGTKPWEGKRNTTSEQISTPSLRELVRDTHQSDGPDKEADLVGTERQLYDSLISQLEAQQRYRSSDEMAKAGFKGVMIDNFTVFHDDFCPSGWACAITSKCYGFVIHRDGFFEREKWDKIPNSPGDKAMKIYLDGNAVATNRRVHKIHTNLTA